MSHILGFGISILSIIVGIVVIIGCYITGGIGGLREGSAAWILAILGTPTTFLGWVLAKIGLTKGFIPSYISVCFFYLLQYQLIAVLIYKRIINATTLRGTFYLILIIIIILISSRIMWSVLGLAGPSQSKIEDKDIEGFFNYLKTRYKTVISDLDEDTLLQAINDIRNKWNRYGFWDWRSCQDFRRDVLKRYNQLIKEQRKQRSKDKGKVPK